MNGYIPREIEFTFECRHPISAREFAALTNTLPRAWDVSAYWWEMARLARRGIPKPFPLEWAHWPAYVPGNLS